MKNRFSIRQHQGIRILEAANARQRPKVMVERAILLHQHHDVLDVAERSAPGRLLPQHPSHIRRQDGRRGAKCGEPCGGAKQLPPGQ